MNKLISIIIPVYNAEKTLSLCIESIIEQTDIRWEAILISLFIFAYLVKKFLPFINNDIFVKLFY